MSSGAGIQELYRRLSEIAELKLSYVGWIVVHGTPEITIHHYLPSEGFYCRAAGSPLTEIFHDSQRVVRWVMSMLEAGKRGKEIENLIEDRYSQLNLEVKNAPRDEYSAYQLIINFGKYEMRYFFKEYSLQISLFQGKALLENLRLLECQGIDMIGQLVVKYIGKDLDLKRQYLNNERQCLLNVDCVFNNNNHQEGKNILLTVRDIVSLTTDLLLH